MKKILLFSIIILFSISFISAAWTSNLNNKLIAYWPMNETTGVISQDVITGAYNSTRNALLVVNSSGKIGYGTSLSDNANGTFNTQLIHGTDNWTWSIWLSADGDGSLTASGTAIGSSTNLAGAMIGSSYTTQLRYSSWAGNGVPGWGIDDVKTSIDYVKGNWYHIVVRRNGTNVSIWQNGTVQNSGTIAADYNLNGYQLFGQRIADGDYCFNGKMDEVGVWNRSLTDAEILQLYNNGDGISYISSGIDINSPSNNAVFLVNQSISFNTTTNLQNELKNVTFFIDNKFNESISVGIYNNYDAGAAEIRNSPWEYCTNITLNRTGNLKINFSSTYGNYAQPYYTVRIRNVNKDLLEELNDTDDNFMVYSSNTYTPGNYGICLASLNATGGAVYFDDGLGNGYVIAGTGLPVGRVPYFNVEYNTIFESIFTKNFSDDGIYAWYVSACDISNVCSNSSIYNVSIQDVIFNSATYNTTTQIGNTESYILNITSNGISSAIFTFDNASYSPSISTSGNESIISYTFSPLSAGIKQFNWTITSTTGNVYRSSNYNQSVNLIGIDDCTTFTNTILNFTLYDEENQTFIAAGSAPKIEVQVNIYPTNAYPTNSIITFNKTYNYNNATICLNQSLLTSTTYYMDVQVRYSASGYSKEFYNIQKYTLTNSTALQHIRLFDLLTADTTPFTITFKDKNFIVVQDALVVIQRKYISEGVYKTVEIPKTDIYGKAIVHLDTDSVLYTISFIKNGVLMASFNNIMVSCTDYYGLNCPINLNEVSSDIIIPDFNKKNNIYYSTSFNSSTRKISVSFTSSDGSANTILLLANKSDMFSNTTVCTTSLTSSSGNFDCTVSNSYGNISIRSCLYSNNQLLSCDLFTIQPDVREVFGDDGYFFVLLIVITIPLLFITSYIGMVIGVILGLILCGALMIYSGGAMFAVTSSLIWLIVAGFIIIWKINQRGQS